MLISVTESCSMGCTHCMSNAVPCDRHMDFATFKDSVEFALKYQPECAIVLSGGECMEHPQFKEFLEYALERIQRQDVGKVLVISNGCYMQEDGISKWLLALLESHPKELYIRVTHDSRFYPKPVDLSLPIFNHENVVLVKRIDNIYPQGRALKLDKSQLQKFLVPTCFTWRMSFNKGSTYKEGALATKLSVLLKMSRNPCIPVIRYDGGISMGEVFGCPKVANIQMDELEILNAMRDNQCNNCRDNYKTVIERSN